MRDKYSETLAGKLIDELTKIRKEQGLSHEKLAEKTTMSRAAISFIESHKRIPTILSCIRIAKALEVRLGDLINKFDK